MTQMVKELMKLLNISELVQDQEMARLADVSKRIEKVQLEVSKLNRDLDHLLNGEVSGEGASLLQCNASWQEWRRGEVMTLNARLSVLQAERESTRIVAKKAFGRAQAVQGLIEQTKSK